MNVKFNQTKLFPDMLATSAAFAGFSVDDLEAAYAFYTDKLGLQVARDPMGFLHVFTQGNNPIVIYPKDDHQPATYTVLNFLVEDIQDVVHALAAKGVPFAQYGPPIQTDSNGICWDRIHGMAIAWPLDPAGNILSLIQEGIN